MRRNDLVFLLLVLLILLFLLWTRLFFPDIAQEFHARNTLLFQHINQGLDDPVSHALFPFITSFGDPRFLLILAIMVILGAIFLRPDLSPWARAAVVTLVLLIFADIAFKPLYQVDRPIFVFSGVHYFRDGAWEVTSAPLSPLEVPSHHRDKSFPSGHALGAFALAGYLWHVRRLRWPALCLAALVAVSRIVLGVHYPADVFLGGLLGFLIGFLVVRVVVARRGS